MRYLFVMALSGILAPMGGHASNQTDGDLCLEAARIASEETGVPLRLLRAITQVETQWKGQPWPWTMNRAGEGYRYPSRDQAVEAAEEAIQSGEFVDIGCFQINTKWHGDAFQSVESMFDPLSNARHAARFLIELHDQSGDWPSSISAYHSRDPDKGKGYLARVATALSADGTAENSVVQARRNGFPLLVTGAAGINGSLVPRLAGVSPLIGGP